MKIEWEKGSSLPKYLLIGLGIIVLLALFINILVNLAANFLKDSIVNSKDNLNKNIDFNLSARLFPYPKLAANHLVYKYQGKPVLSVGKADLGFSFMALFKGNLHIYSINFSQVLIDLPNFPKATIHESTNGEFSENYKTGASFLQEKKPAAKNTIESTFLGVDAINLEDINLIYSSSPEYSPLHFKEIKVDRLSSGKAQFHITANGDFQNIPFKAVADLSLQQNRPISINLSITEALLNQLTSRTSSSVCPLNQLTTDIIKGLNPNIELTIYPIETQGNTSPRKTLIQITGPGISLEEGMLPANLQQTLHNCFDYQLQDKTIRIGSEPVQP